ncbi:hypothetical protein JKP88DRAFT_310842 [Tribonema minus]|uniref:Uncharacterized protein n=1 Tax=Tribonema minus TaxID=303371 RepID=A0A836CGQ6_9STRA|nr:hypothetical protein JKP88DRAFT_310842 [Tribonema minus]
MTLYREGQFADFEDGVGRSGSLAIDDGKHIFGSGAMLSGIGRSLMTWRCKGTALEVLETSAASPLDHDLVRLTLPAPIACTGAVQIFDQDNQVPVTLCVITAAGHVFRLVLAEPEEDLTDDDPSASAAKPSLLSPVAVAAGVLASIRLEDVPGAALGHVPEAEGGRYCHWKDRNTLALGVAPHHLLIVNLSTATGAQQSTSLEPKIRLLPEVSVAARMRTMWAGDKGAEVLAVSSAETTAGAAVVSLSQDWRLRVWSLQTGACTATADVRHLLGLEAAQLLSAAAAAAGAHASSRGTALSATFTDPTLPEVARFVMSLHCRGSMTGQAHHYLVDLRAGRHLDIHGELGQPCEGVDLLSAAVDIANSAVWAVWSPPAAASAGAAAAGSAAEPVSDVLCTYNLAELSDAYSHSAGAAAAAPERRHECRGAWRAALAAADAALADHARAGGWAAVARERGCAGLAALLLSVEAFYLQRVFVRGRFGRGAVERALVEFAPRRRERRALSRMTALQLQHEVLCAVRDELREASQALRGAIGGPADGAETLPPRVDAALTQLSDGWRAFLAAASRAVAAGDVPLALLLPPLRNEGSDADQSTVVVRRGGAGALLPGTLPLTEDQRDADLATLAACAAALARAVGAAAAFDDVVAAQLQAGGARLWQRSVDEVGGYGAGRGGYDGAYGDGGGGDGVSSRLQRLARERLVAAFVALLHPAAAAERQAAAAALVMDEEEESDAKDGRAARGELSPAAAAAVAHVCAQELQALYVEARDAACLLAVLAQPEYLGWTEWLEAELAVAIHFMEWACALFMTAQQRMLPPAPMVRDDVSWLFKPQLRAAAAAAPAHTAQQTVLEALLLALPPPHVPLLPMPAALLRMCARSAGGSGDGGSGALSAGGAPHARLTALEQFLYAAAQPRALLPLLGVALRGGGFASPATASAAAAAAAQLDEADAQALLRLRAEVAAECYLAEARRAGDAGDARAAERLYAASLQLFSAAIPREDLEPDDDHDTHPFIAECWHAAARAAAAAAAADESELRRATDVAAVALPRLNAFSQRLLRPLVRWPPLAPLLRELLLEGGGGGGGSGYSGSAEDVLNLLAEASAAALRRLAQLQQLMRALELTERSAPLNWDAAPALRLAGDAVRALPPAGSPARALVRAEEAALMSSQFRHAAKMKDFGAAADALCGNPDLQRRKDHTEELVLGLCENGRLGELCALSPCEERDPATSKLKWSLLLDVEAVLHQQADRSDAAMLVCGSSDASPPCVNYYACQYAFYTAQGAWRKAARAQLQLHRRLQTLPPPATSLAALRAQSAALSLALAALRRAPTPGERALIEIAAADAPAVMDVDDNSFDLQRQQQQAAGVRVRLTAPPELRAERALVRARVTLTEARAPPHATPHRIAAAQADSAEAAIGELLAAGCVEAAAALALAHWPQRAARARRDAALARVVAVLANACARYESNADGALETDMPLSDAGGAGPLTPPGARAGPEADRRRGDAWALLRELLFRLDGAETNFALHVAAVRAVLETRPRVPLPRWLVASIEGQRDGGGGAAAAALLLAAFAGGAAHPALLLGVLIEHGELIEACGIAARLFDLELADKGELAARRRGRRAGRDWVPYQTLDALFAACEQRLSAAAGGGDSAALRLAHDCARDALELYLRDVVGVLDGGGGGGGDGRALVALS